MYKEQLKTKQTVPLTTRDEKKNEFELLSKS